MTWYKKTAYTAAKKTVYNGRKFDSKFESTIAQELDFRMAAGEVLSWTPQVRIPLEVNGYKICDYYIDFVAELADGTTEYIEAKGFSTNVWKFKWKLFLALYEDRPDTKITVIFQGKSWRPRGFK